MSGIPDGPREQPDDAGSGTVLVLAMVLVLLVAVVAATSTAQALGARARAGSAADLAALAGAQVLLDQSAQDPCAVADRVAEHNGAELASCEPSANGVLRVQTRVPVRVPWGELLAHGRARAGPPELAPR